MTHDPLCMDHGLIGFSTYDCTCPEIAKVRADMRQPGRVSVLIDEAYVRGQRDMLAKCIAALETDDLHSEDPSWDGTNWNNAVFECREVLRALQQPTEPTN